MNVDGIKKLFKSKTAKIVIVCVIALLLLLAVWKVFFKSENTSGSAQSYAATEEERRLSLLLEKLEGVGETIVMVTKSEDGTASAVVVFDGADGIMTRLRIAEVVASALNISEKDVLVCAAS